MPYCSEKIKLPEHLDRRRKLMSADKATIEARYKRGEGSLRSLALEYGVSKKTIQLIVNPEIKRKSDQYIKENWPKYRLSKQEHAKCIRNLRHYKHELYLKHEISKDDENVL